MPSHSILHVEFSADDPAAAGQFYADLFGWQVETVPDSDYVTFEASLGPGGGFTATDHDLIDPGDVLVYVATDDVAATLDHAKSLGASILMERTEIPDVGWMGMFVDLTGNKVAVINEEGF